ncbi:MAG: xanthine dehydrogenase family protein subunit M [Dehalococcoidia bacterium]
MVTFYRRLPRFDYLAPKTVDEALSLLSQYKGKAKVIAGGTDLVPKLKRRQIETPACIVALKGISDLDYIRYDETYGLRFGALTTIRAIETSPVIREKFTVLAQAASSMGSVQVRNRGTVGGNICNAVPSADTAPALLTLQARLKIVSHKSERTVDIGDFFTGPNETILTDEELLEEIMVPHLPLNSRGIYLKLSPRKSMDLAIVGVAAVLISEDAICKDVRIALGAVAPTPMRAEKAEYLLIGKKLSDGLVNSAAQIASEESQPIDDHRASAEYRKEMVKVLTRRALSHLLG